MLWGRFQQIAENPFVELADFSGRKIEKANPGLACRIRPRHFSSSLNWDSGLAQLEAHSHLLARAQRSDGLDRQAGVIQIANDAAIGVVKSDVGQSAERVPMLLSRRFRGNGHNVHESSASCRAVELVRKACVKILVPGCSLPGVPRLVPVKPILRLAGIRKVMLRREERGIETRSKAR